MPALRNHTHYQVAQKNQHTDQNLSKSMATQAQRLPTLKTKKEQFDT